jgi:hypothetical protein
MASHHAALRGGARMLRRLLEAVQRLRAILPDMPAFRPAPLKLRRDASGAIRIAAAPDRSPIVARAAAALAQLSERASAPDAGPVDVQLVVQVSDSAAYHRWRSDREALWRAEGGRYTTAGWPAKLTPEALAAVLLPLPYGATVGRGRKAPRVVAEPLFTTRSRADGSSADDLAVGLIAEWLHQAAPGPALRLAPPLLELGTERRVLDLGLAWPLAAADADADATPS